MDPLIKKIPVIYTVGVFITGGVISRARVLMPTLSSYTTSTSPCDPREVGWGNSIISGPNNNSPNPLNISLGISVINEGVGFIITGRGLLRGPREHNQQVWGSLIVLQKFRALLRVIIKLVKSVRGVDSAA